MTVDNMWSFVRSKMRSLEDLLVVLITKGGERGIAIEVQVVSSGSGSAVSKMERKVALNFAAGGVRRGHVQMLNGIRW